MKTYAELLAETKSRVKEITVADAMALRHTTGDVQFVDCRDEKEFNLGKIPGAFTVARSNLEKNIEGQVTRDKPVVVYCANGNRSAFAAEVMSVMGYDVKSLKEGFSGWIAANGDVE